jgi:hypothetical protein
MMTRTLYIPQLVALGLILASVQAAAWSGDSYTSHVDDPVLTSTPLPAWGDFVSGEGIGWEGVFESNRGLVHRGYGPPVDLGVGLMSGPLDVERACRAFVSGHPGLFGVPEEKLRLSYARRFGRIWYVCFEQVQGGYPVLAGRILMRVRDDGKLFLFGDESFPNVRPEEPATLSQDEALLRAVRVASFDVKSDTHVGSRLVILPVDRRERPGFELCWEVRLRTRGSLGNWYVYVDAHDGTLVSSSNRLWKYTIRGTVTGEVLPQFFDDPRLVEPFPHETVKVIPRDSTNTNSRGNYSIGVDSARTYTVLSRLYGDYVRVVNDDGPEAVITGGATPSEPHSWTWRAPEDGLAEEMNAYYHINRAHDWIKGRPFNFDRVDYMMNVTVRWGNGVNGAFFDGYDMYLGEGDSLPSGMRSLALFSDVIYHEYAHAITSRVYSVSGGNEFWAMMEGFSDYVAATLNDDPLIGNGGLYLNRPYLRTLHNDLVHPDDFGVSAHHDGQIVAGAIWDLRNLEGAGLVDSLWFYAIQGEPLTFQDLLIEFLVADDDNGNISDGTPHDCSIYHAFGRHGIGQGTGISIEHTPHKDTENTEGPYTIAARVYTEGRPPPIKLCYRGRRDREYQVVWMTRTGNPDEYAAEIPGQQHGTLVEYYIETRCVRMPNGAPDWDIFSFYVGLDTVPPEITHRSLPDQAVEGLPFEINAEIVDNVGVRPLPSLEYRVNGGTEYCLDMARLGTSDVYYANMDTSIALGDLVQYRIVAHDSSSASNVAYAPESGSYFVFQICQGFFDDMESGQGGWIHSSTPGYVDEWRLTDRRHLEVSDSLSWGCGRDSGDYSNMNHSILETPIVNVGFDSRLIFWHCMDSETIDFYQAFDGGIVEVSSDSGNSWDHVVPNGGYPFLIVNTGTSPIPAGTRCYAGSFGWRWAEFNLAAYYGDIKIRFRFGSNHSETAEGWYIDNVQVIECPPPGVSESMRRSDRNFRFELRHAFPNPSRRTVVLNYIVPSDGHVKLDVYTVSGHLVRRLINGHESRGKKTFLWDGYDDRGAEVASGIYFVTLRADDKAMTRKVEILR